MQEKNNDVTILVNSCDLYEDAWEPFFKLLHIQWSDCPYDIVLNTETTEYHCDFMNVRTICSGKDRSWTERVKYAIDNIATEFILFSLEDFFLTDKVNVNLWEETLLQMKADSTLGQVWFSPKVASPYFESKKRINKLMFETNIHCVYRVNATLALWRKEFFRQMLFISGDAWSFESNATKLSRFSKFKAAYYSLDLPKVFSYSTDPEFGLGITQKKWLVGNKALFDKYGISVNFSNLGCFDKKITYSDLTGEIKETNRRKKKIKRALKYIKRNYKFLKSLIRVRPKFIKYCRELQQKQR